MSDAISWVKSRTCSGVVKQKGVLRLCAHCRRCRYPQRAPYCDGTSTAAGQHATYKLD